MMYGQGIVPSWFYLLVFMVFILFVVIGYFVTRTEKDLQLGGDGKLANKAIYYENRFRSSSKRAEIIDVKTNYAGFVKRDFHSRLNQLWTFFFRQRSIHFTGEGHDGKLKMTLHNESVKKGNHIIWQAEVIQDHNIQRFEIEGQKEKGGVVRLSFSYGGEFLQVYHDKENGEIRFSKDQEGIAVITYQRRLSPKKVFIDSKEGELPLLLLTGIYEVIRHHS
ncbi:hypothetical protein LCM10_02010 [Rossellomorea aquimaris]|uniref:tubby C-terminal domain-like protein n=1 Tax=Rossellomorea aquimaris TaxID=189382 RepID=UPI001CD552C8|nr:hypothetical protein [Rossellomorea aquimaris]MCA1053746.1 hypothetical protein [Rossellomorea aquimaris]